MKQKCYAPIAIFGFNRADLVENLVGSLELNPEWQQSDVFVFLDGPRTAAEARRTDLVKTFFERVYHPSLTIVARDENLGLKKAISDGITEVCKKYDRVIVLEDDLILSRDALRYFNDALEQYDRDRRVWSICADLPDLDGYGRGTAHFVPWGSSWGWATWSNRWSEYLGAVRSDAEERRSVVFRQRLNGHGIRNFEKMLLNAERGLVGSWFVYWQLTIARCGGLSLFPPVPMVKNAGFNSGTHASRFSLPYIVGLEQKKLGNYDFDLPQKVEIDFVFADRVINSPEFKILRMNSALGSMRRRLKRFWAGLTASTHIHGIHRDDT